MWASEEIMRIPIERVPELLARPAPAPAALDEAPAWGHSAEALLMLGWILGVSVGLLWLARGWRLRCRVIVSGVWRAEWWTDERQGVLAHKVGLRAFPRVCCSPAAPMPMVVGLWRPCIVLPEVGPGLWGQPQWEAVLLHEAAHIAQRCAYGGACKALYLLRRIRS